MRKIIKWIILVLLLSLVISYFRGEGTISKSPESGNISLRVVEYKTSNVVVRKSFLAEEYPFGTYVTEGGYETIRAPPGFKFVLIHLEITNIGEERFHLLGYDWKELRTVDGETYSPGITSKILRDSTPDEISKYYFPMFMSIQTLLPGQKYDGWIVFEIPLEAAPEEFRWYWGTFDKKPSVIIKLHRN
jgi:hypothetical protein